MTQNQNRNVRVEFTVFLKVNYDTITSTVSIFRFNLILVSRQCLLKNFLSRFFPWAKIHKSRPLSTDSQPLSRSLARQVVGSRAVTTLQARVDDVYGFP